MPIIGRADNQRTRRRRNMARGAGSQRKVAFVALYTPRPRVCRQSVKPFAHRRADLKRKDENSQLQITFKARKSDLHSWTVFVFP